MTGTTPGWGLPYPEADTLITDSAAIVQELAEKIDAALSQVTASDTYTIPGTLVETFTASGTFTPPPGVTVVSVAVIAGGSNGDPYTGEVGGKVGGGGGAVRVYRDLPVSGPVSVVIGAAGTGTAFGPHTAPAKPDARLGTNTTMNPDGIGYGGLGTHNGVTQPQNRGADGVQINGTYYAGGGGGGNTGSTTRHPGGAGGGGGGATYNQNAIGGAAGTGGGGGGAAGGNAGLGGSGRVIVYTEQPYRRSKILAAPAVDPRIVAALDDSDTMTGAYAVDPDLDLTAQDPRLVPFPADPQPTGRTFTVPVDPADPDGPTHEVPEFAWPEAGWTYDGNTWHPPQEATA